MPAIPVHYTGILSRLKKNKIEEQKNHLFISLSGPEPQRTLLENKIVNEISHYHGTATVVRGLPAANHFIPSTRDIIFYNHLNSEDFNKEIGKADYVISRSGYSTVMDILTLDKKSILIPTPGQTEQEYLAHYLTQKQLAFCVNQKHFTLKEVLQKAAAFDYKSIDNVNRKELTPLISSLLNKISQRDGY
jgi:UDP-N-acetylglucosamine:LPS N-acetylglucosamine transferase